jgi:hypothetical protein
MNLIFIKSLILHLILIFCISINILCEDEIKLGPTGIQTFINNETDIINYTNPIIEQHNGFDVSLVFENFSNPKKIDSLIHLIKNKWKVNHITFYKCNIETTPDSLKAFYQLNTLNFTDCNNIKELKHNKIFPILTYENKIIFNDCNIEKLPLNIEKIRGFLDLNLYYLDNNENFNINEEIKKFTKRKNLRQLIIKSSKKIDFPESIFELIALQSLEIDCVGSKSQDINKIEDKLPNLWNFVCPDNFENKINQK